MWIIFEGLDKVGKGTQENLLLKHNKYGHIVIDRGPAGYYAFDKIYNRLSDKREKEYLKQIDQINHCDNVYIIYLYTEPEKALDRIRNHNEYCDYDYKKAQSIYSNVIYKYDQQKVISINTTNQTINETFNLIKEFADKKGFNE